MFRLYRKTIFPRWNVNRKTSADKKVLKHPKALIICSTSENQNHSNQNNQKKQHADKQEKQYWDDPQFHFNFFRTPILETAGWLGTVALYFSYHLKHINSIFECDKINSSCIFSNIVLAMPRRQLQDEKSCLKLPDSISVSSNAHNEKEEKVKKDSDILRSFKSLTQQYVSSLQNSNGISNINKNDRRAFRSFQSAARLGSSQGFYNLGLCYHMGKGTKVNLNMAAFCYRKAAMKGHGLASFNLAIFFYKGIGGLPVDAKIAKELLAEAAEKGVPEAQLYFGIEFLEEEKWREAVRIFTNLADKNISDAQYYLGLCYENGLGVDKNKKLAFELFTKSASCGNKKALYKLQNQEKDGMTFSKPAVVKSMERNNTLHPSTSFPELSAVVKKSNFSTTNINILSYLDLITPFLIEENNDSKSKNNLYIDKNTVVKEYSSTLLPFRSISLLMEVKT